MDDKLKARIEKLRKDTLQGGYKLNPDDEFVADLVAGMLKNMERYGIESCPCRLFEGTKDDNMDIVCPCVYRDDDLAEFGACFCALYVNDSYQTVQVPDRRQSLEERRKSTDNNGNILSGKLPYPVFRCKVCGYLMANNSPPHICPICKAGKERFERFM